MGGEQRDGRGENKIIKKLEEEERKNTPSS